jgi:hypothetical protein
MAWPLSRITTYVAGVSQIAASAMNSIQDYVIGLYLGTYSVKALVVDGTGGAATTPPDGTLRVSSTAGFGTSVPTPATAKHDMYKPMIPMAMGYVTWSAGTPSFAWGMNVASITDVGPGILQVDLSDAVTSMSKTVVLATTAGSTGIVGAAWSSTSQVQLSIIDNAGNALDPTGIYFVIYSD